MERKSQSSPVLVFAAIALVFAASGCAKLRARDDLNKGVQAFTAAQFDSAIEYFKEAKQLDPTLMNARLYLAQAYGSQYIPGAPSAENKRNAQQAIEEWKEVLQIDPNNLNAIDGIGSMLYNMAGTPFDPKMMEESKTYHEQHMKLRPNDPEPYYWIGVIDYWIAFRANAQLRSDYNDKARKRVEELDPLPPAVRAQFAKENAATVDEGIDNLNKAISLRTDYDDALAYLNLLLRQKGDMEPTAAGRDADNKQADALLEKVKEIRQKKMTAPVSQ
ncbi:MAG TPA: hypothetical protein VGT03_15635 [Candidatus Acidoferrales bacterium]|nr:hypothetical protein [Candidatus Acidoferrales bacterium]